MRRSAGWIGLLVLGAATALAARAEEDAPSAAEGLARATALFDRLELPDPTAHPFARVWSGNGWKDEEGAWHITPAYGIVVAGEGGAFEVLFTNLGTGSFQTSPPDAPGHERIAWEEASLVDHIREARDRWEAEAKAEPSYYLRKSRSLSWGPGLEAKGEAVLLAWICTRRGLEAEATALWSTALAQDADKPLLEAVKTEVRTTLLWQVIEAFGDPEIPLEAVLGKVDRLGRAFPDDEENEHAKTLRDALARQMALQPIPEPSAEAPVGEQVAWLIDRLTTQHGVQNGSPGRCDVFEDERGEDSPAHRLVALGFDAVPQLIGALGDLRFTRSIGCVRWHYFSHHVLRVCDVALDVLQAIAGRGFWDAPYFSEHMSQEDADVRALTRERVLTWWKDAETKGELAYLREEVTLGGHNAAYLAKRLLRKYPDHAVAPIRAGLAAAPGERVRGYLVQVLGDVETDAVTGLLREVLRDDESLLVRTTAATQLLERDPEGAVDAMVAEWAEAPPEAGADAVLPYGRNAEEWHIEFLIGCGHVRGIEAVRRRMEESAVGWRVHAILNLVFAGWSMPYALQTPGEDQELAPPPVRAAAEALLVEHLADTGTHEIPPGTFSSSHDRFIEPRVCDYAAWALAEIFPDRYAPFDPRGTRRARDRRITELTNVWRAKRSEPLLPVPDAAPPLGPVTSPTGDLVRAWAAAASAEERAGAHRQVLARGLFAVPTVRAMTEGIPQAQALLDELALLVAEVDLQAPEGVAWGALGERLRALNGRPLEAAAVIDIVIAGLKHLGEGANAFRLHFHRDEAHLGFVVRARLETRSSEHWSGGLSHGYRLRVGTKKVGGGSGGSSVQYKARADAWSDEKAELEILLGAGADAILDATFTAVIWPDR